MDDVVCTDRREMMDTPLGSKTLKETVIREGWFVNG